jgi:hypothetical protein
MSILTTLLFFLLLLVAAVLVLVLELVVVEEYEEGGSSILVIGALAPASEPAVEEAGPVQPPLHEGASEVDASKRGTEREER